VQLSSIRVSYRSYHVVLLTCDGAADFASRDAGAVPDHPVLGPLVGLAYPVGESGGRVVARALVCHGQDRKVGGATGHCQERPTNLGKGSP